ncbi:unnamed protein product [Sphacelaria rigidula]
MRTIAMVNACYDWPGLSADTRKYVVSCGCRRRKRTNSHTVAMRLARFLQPWEVIGVDISDTK